jgi:N-acetylglutamate synthase-like GNAT family acetyltransferase
LEKVCTDTRTGGAVQSGRLWLHEAVQADRERLAAFITASGLEAAGTLERGTRFWVAEEGEGRIVGSTGMEYGPEAVLFRSTAVSRERRHHGLALAFYELRIAIATAEGYRYAYGFCDTPEFMLRTGWQAVPVAELVEALPQSHQVAHFARLGWLWTEHAFRRELRVRWQEQRSS